MWRAAGSRGWYSRGILFDEAHLILNPTANNGRAAACRENISAYLKRRGVGAVWHPTKGSGDATRVVGGLPEGALVVAAGGDGTVREVAAACARTERVLGVLPIGSGNDYVKALGVGTRLDEALRVLVEGRVKAVDTGEVNGVAFNNGLGVGFDAEVAAGVAEAPKYLGGTGRYLWSVAKLLGALECHEATLTLDGDTVVEAKTILVAAALGTTYGARFKLAPEALLDDGLFDIVWSEELSRTEVLRLVPMALRGTLLRHPKIHLARASRVRVELQRSVPAHVDGEPLQSTRRFEARVSPGALRVLVP